MKLKVTILALSGLLLAGCANFLEASARFDRGLSPPDNYRDIIKADFSSIFINSNSPLYEFTPPVKWHTTEPRVVRLVGASSGWLVCGTVNWKPSFGGYAGYSTPIPFLTVFKNGILARKLRGQPRENASGIAYDVNLIIDEVCRDAVKAAGDIRAN